VPLYANIPRGRPTKASVYAVLQPYTRHYERRCLFSSNADIEARVRTSAAAAAAALGSFVELPSPNVRGGPPTVRFGALATLLGIDAFVAGAGAEPNVRP
jgi:hypothetical protein